MFHSPLPVNISADFIISASICICLGFSYVLNLQPTCMFFLAVCITSLLKGESSQPGSRNKSTNQHDDIPTAFISGLRTPSIAICTTCWRHKMKHNFTPSVIMQDKLVQFYSFTVKTWLIGSHKDCTRAVIFWTSNIKPYCLS